MKTRKLKALFLNEEWLIVLLGFVILAFIAIFPEFMYNIKMLNVKSLVTASGWINAAYTFVFLFLIILITTIVMKRPVKGLLVSFIVIFVLTMIAQLLASIPFCKEYGLESVLFAVLLGLIISNVFGVPEWMKPAIQSEFYIKIGIICLGATIIFGEIVKSGAYGLAQALLVVLCVWYFAFWISRKVFKVDDEMSTMIASSVSICGVSAAIATCGTIRGNQKKLSYVISLVMVVAIPMLYIMPLLCDWILPMIFPNNELAAQQVAGAWLGGTIDTTAAVAASGALLGEVAGDTAVIVKASQNVLLGLAAFAISLFWSVRDTGSVMETKGSVIWHRFPKFVLGMVIASAVFSLWFNGGVEIDGNMVKYKAIAKNFQGMFFSIAFVCIGLETRFKEIFNKENRASLKAFLTAQTFNIIFTFIVAVVIFGFIAN
ncbi:MAG: putative sulfate exporter family transporter [Bacteroidales bacterium]|nr:putative sulfate exporter family transporter [Lentimicrobiaceae bacterium]MBQ2852292.1 putative sulfate exporter family transporter [Bacteroidales bacterium]